MEEYAVIRELFFSGTAQSGAKSGSAKTVWGFKAALHVVA
jgi:hypothetical protein